MYVYILYSNDGFNNTVTEAVVSKLDVANQWTKHQAHWYQAFDLDKTREIEWALKPVEKPNLEGATTK